MNNFFSRVAEITMMGDYPFLHWIVFDTIGLMFLKLLVDIFIYDAYLLIQCKDYRKFKNIMFIIFILVAFLILMFILYRLCVYKSDGGLFHVAIFSLILTIYVLLKTIYSSILKLPTTKDNVLPPNRKYKKHSKR